MSDTGSQRGQRSALIAIDGTDSREWRVSEQNSHVLRFFREYQGDKVKDDDTTHGPKTLGGDVDQIFQTACDDATNFYNSGGNPGRELIFGARNSLPAGFVPFS